MPIMNPNPKIETSTEAQSSKVKPDLGSSF